MQTEYDILVVVDATGSMGSYLDALRSSIPEILALSTLSGSFQRLGIIAYRDYTDGNSVLNFSGWNSDLTGFAQGLDPWGGGDYPEAAKTALIKTLEIVERKTLVLWYADAPPHHRSVTSINREAEIKAFPQRTTDWVKLAYEVEQKDCVVFSFIPTQLSADGSAFFVFLSQVTDGICVRSPSHDSAIISRLTLDVLLAWMGRPPVDDPVTGMKPFKHIAKNVHFELDPRQASPKPSDEDKGCHGYLPPIDIIRTRTPGRGRGGAITTAPPGTPAVPLLRLSEPTLDLHSIPQRKLDNLQNANLDLAKRFFDPSEIAYHAAVYASLREIISTNVYSLSWNPIFGLLWRAVCKDHSSVERIELVDLFAVQVGKIKDEKRKEEMKLWLEGSFDSTKEIDEIIARAPDAALGNEQKRMYLDLDSRGADGVKLTRTELLEVSRSCYSGVLEKLAGVLVHLKLVEAGVVLAPHQRVIPVSLSPKQLFSIMPHLVVPGTLYSPRAASIMASLALITSVPFLVEPATELLSSVKGTWLKVEVPENISYDCAKLLLQTPPGVALTEEERNTYQEMREYKLLELNLDSKLQAMVPWTPDKSRGVGDRKVVCEKCKIKRSTTMMSSDKVGLCGICADSTMNPVEWPASGVLESCWVECSVKTCRAQYVVENVAGLRVRPKCYYCRNNRDCPYETCTRCQNRVVVPLQFRSPDKYLCPCCDSTSQESTRVSVVKQETSARILNAQNTVTWLGLTPNPDLFLNKSAFKLFQAHGAPVFHRTQIDAELNSKAEPLTLGSKPIHNASDVRTQIEALVKSGTVEQGTCTLCFADRPYPKLLPACGRKGCAHRVDEACLRRWYGANEPGKLLVTMQCLCPFCRRAPTVQIVSRWNARMGALSGLREAMNDRQWYHAWCTDCGFAKRAVERSCADGERLPGIRNFVCEECQGARNTQRQVLGVKASAKQAAWVADVESAGLSSRTTMCPSCGMLVEKTFGCNHIHCRCGAHFCHVCGEGFEEKDIYGHIYGAHGGLFDDDGSDEDD
ncbi:hypothetical protein BOTBODRAFT_171538 [Botryobasidium botryosum FD-172 SS1]|uniref:RING-type domain-containing protein n=1 Tax=Botryobasidium botryosum (strain FD-172 SS1) TaxID=930990 RepID=A0A067MQ38_BOTB1|nr:hypothetical protein BOTBODRAFT_171538 [Botryobasidium botryosum FD-172 SS1]